MNPVLLDYARRKLATKIAPQNPRVGADVTAAATTTAAAPLNTAGAFDFPKPTAMTYVWEVVSAASVGISAYHGYKRNNSVGWAIGWGLLGGMFPILVPTIALAQGLGKKHP
jgi:hypothetical protein